MPSEVGFRYYAGSTVNANTAPVTSFGRCLLALEQGQITMRDLEILRELAFGQYLTRDQIHLLALNNVSKSVVRRRLEVLTYLGLIASVRWEEPREENSPLQRVAYCLTLNGIKLLRHYHGRSMPWRPGMAQRHLRQILAVLAANEFRVQILRQKPGLVEQFHLNSHPIGPVAQFRLGGQLVILEAPREEEDAAQISLQRYTRWLDQNPLLFFLVPEESVASMVFSRLQGHLPYDRMLFSTDGRVFGSKLEEPGFMWQWEPTGQVVALALS